MPHFHPLKIPRYACANDALTKQFQELECERLPQRCRIFLVVLRLEEGCSREHLPTLDEAEGGCDDQELSSGVQRHRLHQGYLSQVCISDGCNGDSANVYPMLPHQEQEQLKGAVEFIGVDRTGGGVAGEQWMAEGEDLAPHAGERVRGQGRRDFYDIERDPLKQESVLPFSALSQIRVEAGFFADPIFLLTRKYLCWSA